jgi:hypothetical protein
MDQKEIKKLCQYCGQDVAHKKRHKSQDGKYTCPACYQKQHRLPQRVWAGFFNKKKLTIILLYVFLAVAACAVFWKILEIMNQSEM